MMTSSNGNIFRVTGPLCGKFTGHRWIPLTNASDAELWYLLWSPPDQTIEHQDAGDLRRHHAHYDVTVMKLTVRVIFHLGTTDGLCFWHYKLWYDWLTPLVWFLSPLSPFLLPLNKHSWGWWLRRYRAHYDAIVVIYFNYHIWIPDICRTGK